MQGVGAIVAVVNQKGGVGKTTVVLGLAAAAQARGDRVLVVDADPQANATWALGLEPESVAFGTAEAILLDRVAAARRGVVGSVWGAEVDVLAASGALLDREVEAGGKRAAKRLARALEGVAVEPAALSARGIANVSDLIDAVWEQHNPGLDIAGLIVNRVPPVSHEADRQRDLLARMLGRKTIWEPEIPQRVVITEALAERRPIHALGARSASVSVLFDEHYRRLRALGRKAIRSSST